MHLTVQCTAGLVRSTTVPFSNTANLKTFWAEQTILAEKPSRPLSQRTVSVSRLFIWQCCEHFTPAGDLEMHWGHWCRAHSAQQCRKLFLKNKRQSSKPVSKSTDRISSPLNWHCCTAIHSDTIQLVQCCCYCSTLFWRWEKQCGKLFWQCAKSIEKFQVHCTTLMVLLPQWKCIQMH